MTGDTNWTPYSVPELAGILDDDLTSAWEQVGAWFSADAMLDDAASKLAEARTGLAAVWPPESSPAAQTFFQVVDALTDSMKKTALAANTNANALSQVLDNHSDTKSKVDGLHSAWTINQKMAPADPEFPSPAEWQSSLNAASPAAHDGRGQRHQRIRINPGRAAGDSGARLDRSDHSDSRQ